MSWVSLQSHCRTTGDGKGDVEVRIAKGSWTEGVHYKHDPEGILLINSTAFSAWVALGEQKPDLPELENASGKSALYRCFDSKGGLIYVGISMNMPSRMIQHVNSSQWMVMVTRVEIEWHNSRKAAEAAEKTAIKNERPYFNVVHNKR